MKANPTSRLSAFCSFFWEQGLAWSLVLLLPVVIFSFDGSIRASVAKLLVSGCVLCLFVLGLVFRQVPFRRLELKSPLLLVLSLYLLWIVLSSLFGASPLDPWLDWEARQEGVLSFSSYALLFLLGRSSRKLGSGFITATALGSSTVALMRIGQHYGVHTLSLFMLGGVGKRMVLPLDIPYGSFGNPNFFAAFISLSLPFCFYFLLFEGKRWMALPVVIQVFSLFINGSRGGFLGAMVGIICLLILYVVQRRHLFTRQRSLKALCYTLAALLFFGVFLFLNPEIRLRFMSLFTEAGLLVKGIFTGDLEGLQRIGSGRLVGWTYTLFLLPLYPLFGTGIGGYLPLLYQHFEQEIQAGGAGREKFDRAHNEYLQTAAQSGIPALLFYLAFLYLLFKGIWKHAKGNPRYWALFASITGYMTAAFFGISVPMVACYLWLMLGISSSDQTLLLP